MSLLVVQPLTAQNDLSKTSFNIKLHTGPQFFLQSNMSGAPMPLVGVKAALVFNTTELEFGLGYVTKFLKNQTGTAGQNFLSISYTHHYLIPGFHIHQKLFAKNKHICSASMGVGMVVALANPADTLLNDGSHRINWHPTGRQAIQLGLQLEGTVRYTYGISPHTGFYVAPFFNFKLIKEYVEPNSPQGAPDPNNTYVPMTDSFSTGIMIGFHWMVPFSKTPPGFFADSRIKNKGDQ